MEERIITREMLEALRAGDHEAYASVYCHYRKPLESFLGALMRTRSDAEDVTQEVFMKIWEVRESIDPSKKFKSYLYTIARNSVMNRLHHQKVQNRYNESNSVGDRDEVTQEELLIARETELIVRLTVDQMPRIRKQVYELSLDGQLSNEEIAHRLGITKSNVANHLSLARKDIKHMLAVSLFFFL